MGSEVMVIELKNKNRIYGELKYNQENFQNFSKHSHETLNIVAIKKEQIAIEYHKQTIHYLKPKQLAIFNPKQVHLTSKQSHTAIPYYSLHLHSDWSLALQNELFENSRFFPLTPNIITDLNLSNTFLEICSKILNKNTSEIEKELSDFAKKLFMQYANRKIKFHHNHTLEKVEQYILQNIDKNLNLKEIAKEFGYTSAHLNRLFKEEYGLTLHAFLIDKRIEKAKRLISRNKKATLTEIAYEAGFFDQSHFIRNFKRVYSLSPKKYK